MKSCQEKSTVMYKVVWLLGMRDLKQQQQSAIMYLLPTLSSVLMNIEVNATLIARFSLFSDFNTCLFRGNVSVSQHNHIDMFLTLIPTILPHVKTCFHIDLCVGGIIILALCTHVLPSFILHKSGYGMSPDPFPHLQWDGSGS